MFEVSIRTIVPIILLIGAGFLARRLNLLKSGDERVLSSYVFYFALPALFFINLSEIVFNQETLRFMFSAIAPIILMVFLYIIVSIVFRIKRNNLYLLILSSAFGSFAFFGIPFIMFAFPGSIGEHLAVLSAAAIAVVSVVISIATLEIYKIDSIEKKLSIVRSLHQVALKLYKNPLIVSIFLGVIFSLLNIAVPLPIKSALHMLGKTTATIAIFMLGVFLYGRNYQNLFKAFNLSLLRVILLPLISLVFVRFMGLSNIESAVIILMNAMPVAVSMMVLSERYDFNQDTMASLIMITSLGSIIYLNIWLFVLGI